MAARGGETAFRTAGECPTMVEFDPVLVGLLVLILGFVFFVYLFLRRTVTGFREGMQQGKNRR